MIRALLFLVAVLGAFSIPVRLLQLQVFDDNSATEIYTTSNPKYTGALYTTTTSGQVNVIWGNNKPTTLIDLSGRASNPPPTGVIGTIAIHPKADKLYVSIARTPTPAETTMYRMNDGTTTRDIVLMGEVLEFALDLSSLSNERSILTVPAYNAEAAPIGGLSFGPDGFLYVGVSTALYRDANGKVDPQAIGAQPDNFFGNILRINPDVPSTKDKLAYSIPSDNPLRNVAGVRAESFASGFANPQEFTWQNGNLLIIDINDASYPDELNVLSRNGDYGFNTVAADMCYLTVNCTAPASSIPPVIKFKDNTFTNGVAVTPLGIYAATETTLTLYSADYTQSTDITLLDSEGYDAFTKYRNFKFTDVAVHATNGTVYLVGSGDAKQTIVFTVEPDTSSALTHFTASIAAVLMVIAILL
eukprot:PhF_6_TR18885/c2_g1_i1/m.27502